MGGKSSTSTQSVTIPREVMERYRAVNARAEQTAQTPFQSYSSNPNDFVAPLNPTQQAAIQNIGNAQNIAQPYYNAATQFALSAPQSGYSGINASSGTLSDAQNTGAQYANAASQYYGQANQVAAPYYGAATQGVGDALSYAAPLNSFAAQNALSASSASRPYYDAATGYSFAGGQSAAPEQFSSDAVNRYLSPYLGTVLGTTMQAMDRNNAVQRNALTGDAIKAGAFGGDRAGIAQANLAYNQNLANNQTIANILNQGYGQALGAFQQQQGVDLSARQADLARYLQAGGQMAGLGQALYGQGVTNANTLSQLGQTGYGQQMGASQQMAALGQNLYGQGMQSGQAYQGLGQQQFGQGLSAAQLQSQLGQMGYQIDSGTAQLLASLGSGATNTALQSGQALLGAGTLGQQTDQAGKTALYNQFLQERGYPFQVAQFLANIAMGTGALSGSTTTTTQPTSFFSDARLKDDIEPIGETYDGQQIYRYRMKGDPRHQIGLMAQEVEARHPEAVGLAAGYRTLDYDTATEDAASMGRGLMPRRGYAPGGLVDANDIQALLQSQQQSFGPFGQAGLYGGQKGSGAGAPGYVPNAALPTPKLITAGNAPAPRKSFMQEAMQTSGQIADLGEKANSLWEGGKKGLGKVQDMMRPGPSRAAPPAPVAPAAAGAASEMPQPEYEQPFQAAYGGGVVPRYADGGALPYDNEEVGEDPIKSVLKDGSQSRQLAVAGKPPAAPQGLGSQLMGAANLASSAGKLYGMLPAGMTEGLGSMASGLGAAAAEGVGALGSAAAAGGAELLALLPFLSDRRLKDNIDPVGETYDGQRVYRYDMGDGRTQLGLMAQEVLRRKPEAVGERDGYLTLDYDRATEDAVPRAYGGGLAPRMGYAEGGMPDDEYAIRTIAAEMSGQSPEEARAIARVIDNRRATGRWGDNYQNVVMARSQFEPWSNPSGRNYPMNISRDDPRYIMAEEAFAARGEGEDPTGGALHFWAPKAQTALGRRPPSWDNNDATMIGATRFVRNVDEGSSRALAYAPEGGVAGAEGPRRINAAAAGSGRVGGVAPPNEARGEQGLLERLTPNRFDGQPQKPGEFFTSKQFWIPALTGLGAMASSPSLYAGSAILQGLGAGAQAYSNLEKREADIGLTKAETGAQQATTSSIETTTYQRSLQERPYGNIVWLANGEIMLLGDYQKLLKEGKAPPLLGKKPANADEVLRRWEQERGLDKAAKPTGVVPATASATPRTTDSAGRTGVVPPATATPPATTTPPTTAPKPGSVATELPFTYAYDADSRKSAEEEKTVMLNGGPQGRDSEAASKLYRDSVLPQGEAARAGARYMGELAENLSRAAQGGGVNVMGSGFEGRAQFVGAVNTMLRAFGIEQRIGDADIVKQINDKIETLQAAGSAAAGNQESIAALQMLKRAVASPTMDPEAASKLGADLWVQNQRMIDRDLHLNRYVTDSGGYARKASADFNRIRNDGVYNKETKVLSDLIRSDPALIKDLRSGRFTPDYIDKKFEKAYGLRNMSRYFVGAS